MWVRGFGLRGEFFWVGGVGGDYLWGLTIQENRFLEEFKKLKTFSSFLEMRKVSKMS